MKNHSPIRFLFTALFAACISLLATSCSESANDPVDDDDPELITTVRFLISDVSGNVLGNFIWEDIDGPGGNEPNRIDTMKFDADTQVYMDIFVSNRSVTPEEDITQEIIDEGDQHQFFFTVTDAELSISYDDGDVNGLPIGQHNFITVANAGQGTLQCDLSHFDDPAEKDGVDPSDETDISIIMPVVIN